MDDLREKIATLYHKQLNALECGDRELRPHEFANEILALLPDIREQAAKVCAEYAATMRAEEAAANRDDTPVAGMMARWRAFGAEECVALIRSMPLPAPPGEEQ